jgi:hypothetical protein
MGEPAPAEKECEHQFERALGTNARYCRKCHIKETPPDTITISREVAEEWLDYAEQDDRFNEPMIKELRKSLAVERNGK